MKNKLLSIAVGLLLAAQSAIGAFAASSLPPINFDGTIQGTQTKGVRPAFPLSHWGPVTQNLKVPNQAITVPASVTSTTLSAAITTTGQTAITVTSATGFPSSGTFLISIDTEIMVVTAGAGTTSWTVSRANAGTTAATHLISAAVYQFANTNFPGETYREYFPLIANTNEIQLCYSNHQWPGTENAYAITVGASYDYIPNGTATNSVTPLVVTFGGQNTIAIQPGASVCSDKMFGPFLVVDGLWVRTWVNATNWPTIGHNVNYSLEGQVMGDQRTTANFKLSFQHAGLSYGPSLITGPVPNAPTVGWAGDSICDNSGETAFPSVGGFIGRGLNNLYGYNRACEPGETLATALAASGLFSRAVYASNASNLVSEYGTNDNGAGTTAAVTQANMLAYWAIFARNGQRVFQTTILPKTSSTDSWATTANQTAAGQHYERQRALCVSGR